MSWQFPESFKLVARTRAKLKLPSPVKKTIKKLILNILNLKLSYRAIRWIFEPFLGYSSKGAHKNIFSQLSVCPSCQRMVTDFTSLFCLHFFGLVSHYLWLDKCRAKIRMLNLSFNSLIVKSNYYFSRSILKTVPCFLKNHIMPVRFVTSLSKSKNQPSSGKNQCLHVWWKLICAIF